MLTGTIYALIAIGFTLIYSITGFINLAQGAFVGLGALVMYFFNVTSGWPLFPAFVVTVAIMTVVAVAVHYLVVQPALGKLSGSHFLLLTAGLLVMFQGAALVLWGSQPYSVPSFSGEKPFNWGRVLISTQAPWILGTLVVVVGGMWWLLNRTSFGKALRACAENRDAASLMGIRVSRMIMFGFAASGAIGALAGVVISPIISFAFDSAATFTNNGFIAATLGGMGSFLGGVLGGVSLGVLEQISAGFISSLFSNTVAIILLLVVLLWRPGGIMGERTGHRIDVQAPHVKGGYSYTIKDFHYKVWRYSLILGAVILLLPLFVHNAGLINSLVITGIFFLTALGLDLLTGFAGQVSLGQAGFMAIGGYASAVCAIRFHLTPLAGVAAGLVLSLATAAVLGLISARLRGMYLAMATLAFGLLVQSLAVGLMGITGGPSGLVGIPSFSLGKLTFSGNTANYYLVWILVGVIFFLISNLVRSDRGRALRAINTDQTMAQALGINVKACKIQVFLISAALASLAGSLYGFYFHFLSPDMVSSQTSIDLLTMLILGGEGTLIGPLIGVMILVFMPTYFQPLALFKPLVEGLLLVIILLRLPGGMFGGILDAWAWFAKLLPRRLPSEGGQSR